MPEIEPAASQSVTINLINPGVKQPIVDEGITIDSCSYAYFQNTELTIIEPV